MNRKLLYLAVVLSLCGLLILGTVALAQDSQPPERPGDHEDGERPPGESYEPERDGQKPFGRPSPTMRAAGAASLSPAVTLGQPGLSFRYVQTFGVTEEAYPDETSYLNFPEGLFIDASNNIYVIESEGSRMLKFDPSGSPVTPTIGRAGLNLTSEGYEDVLDWPHDVALDGSGNIWIVSSCRVTEFDSSGNFLQVYPDWDDKPWNCGSDPGRFDEATGIVFDSAGRMYISEYYNNRVQVFNFVSGTPVLSNTIGIGVSGADFNYPTHIVMDSSNRLFVADSENHRVQVCTYSSGWSCATFHGTGSPGDGDSELNYPWAVGKDNSNNIYIVDNSNGRIKKCNNSGSSCSPNFITGLNDPLDVVVNASGQVFVTEGWNTFVVSKFNSSGGWVGTFAGQDAVPYVPDDTRLNSPWGIAVDSSGNIYVAEERGHRLIKMDSSGTQLWTIGDAGMSGSSPSRLSHSRGNLAIDTSGRVYVPDSNKHWIKIYNSNGSFYSSIGISDTWGTDNAHLYNPHGVAISPVNGDIYVADRNNDRIQIFGSNLAYKNTLASWTGPSGTDYFCSPQGVAVDKNGNIYVADRGCHRVIKFNSNRVYQYTIGVKDWCDWEYDYLCAPSSVAVDSSNRVYITETWNDRVQVFDSSGAYLTTIGGSWGPRTGDLRNPVGIAVDQAGNVYVTDQNNHRIQKFAPGVPGWVQKNINGFGERQNSVVTTLGAFDGQLYAGTYNWSGNGAQLWRASDGLSWTPVLTNGFGITRNVGIDHLIEFKDNLYAGTWADEVNGGEVWRSSNGSDWSRVVSQGFGDPNNGEVFRFVVFSDTLYASTWSFTNTQGSEIWRSNTGNSGEWEPAVINWFGDANNQSVLSFAVFTDHLYAGTYNWNGTSSTSNGSGVWRTSDGTTWTQVNANGFGSANNYATMALAEFNNYLYAGTANWDPSAQTPNGGQIWRCSIGSGCDDAIDWAQITGDGLGNPQNTAIGSLLEFDNRLYAVTYNYQQTGMEVWRTADGTNWEQVGFAGFGDSNNYHPYWDNSITTFNDRLYVGTRNSANGGEVWLYLHKKVYLPLVRR